jgi:hypothetical protein
VPEIILFVLVFTSRYDYDYDCFIHCNSPSFLQESASDIPANDRFGYLTLKSVVSCKLEPLI